VTFQVPRLKPGRYRVVIRTGTLRRSTRLRVKRGFTGKLSIRLDAARATSSEIGAGGGTLTATVTGDGVCVKLSGALSYSETPSGGTPDTQRVVFRQGNGAALFDFDDTGDPTFSASTELPAGTYQLDISGDCSPPSGVSCTAHLEAMLEFTHG
jgi:hypothetical protein